MPKHEDDWSDSEDDTPNGVETSVLLGVPDGSVDNQFDISDAAVSRIGGHPAFLPSREPPITSSYCKVCDNPMELLVQIWCPFEESPMDRVLYIWGCSRVGCQKKDGSIRAWRGLKFNEKYAAKLEKKLARKAKASKGSAVPKMNPFATGAPLGAPAFGLGAQAFDVKEIEELSANPQEVGTNDEESDASESLLKAMTKATVADSPWRVAPTYPAFYLSTVSEYLPPESKGKISADTEVLDPLADSFSWTSERYENSLDVDPVFERFARRVDAEGQQCLRYELDGVPLPFACDEVYNKLFPVSQMEPLPFTKADFKVVQPRKRVYDPSSVPRCSVCKSKRVFECQLMPNLINVTRKEQELKGGMEWGTCLVFSCSGDCREGEAAQEVWLEEVVYVQWDV